MSSKTIISLIIIVVVVLTLITINFLNDFPEGESCCKDIRHPDSRACIPCDNYRLHERIIYVWRFRDQTNQR